MDLIVHVNVCASLCVYKCMYAHILELATKRVIYPNVLSYTSKIQMYKDVFMGLLLYFFSEYSLFIIKKPQMTACQETFGAHMSMVNGHNKSLLYLELGYHNVCIEECRKD